MQYFITGATGFIGRHLLPLLLARDPESTVHVLVRPGSRHRFAALREELDPTGLRLRAVIGDIAEPNLGISTAEAAPLHGATVFHLAAIYDLQADPDETARVNVQGTRNTVAFANAIQAACLHHISSIAVAGTRPDAAS